MNKKILLIILALVIIPLIFLSINKNQNTFKKEYEKLNNKDYIKVSIPKDSPVINIKFNEFKKIAKKTGVFFVGSYKSQPSRDSIKPLLEAANETGIENIYYIDIKQMGENNYKKILKREKINIPALITVKNGKIIEYISEEKMDNTKYKKMTKEEQAELKKKYIDSINKILICNHLGETC